MSNDTNEQAHDAPKGADGVDGLWLAQQVLTSGEEQAWLLRMHLTAMILADRRYGNARSRTERVSIINYALCAISCSYSGRPLQKFNLETFCDLTNEEQEGLLIASVILSTNGLPDVLDFPEPKKSSGVIARLLSIPTDEA